MVSAANAFKGVIQNSSALPLPISLKLKAPTRELFQPNLTFVASREAAFIAPAQQGEAARILTQDLAA
jgi:hypothetical protein